VRKIFGQFRDMDLSDVQITGTTMEEALSVVTTYIDNLDENRTKGRGLTLLGPSGVGKTMLTCLVLKAAQAKGYRIEAIEYASLVELIKKQYTLANFGKTGNEDAQDDWYRIDTHIRYIKGANKRTAADWILLDDIGREYQSESGWSSQQLFDLLRFRYNRQLPSLLTSNNSMAEFQERYTEGMPSLLHEATEVIALVGEDYRIIGGKGSTGD
jgi:DNA replication protein DnaC